MSKLFKGFLVLLMLLLWSSSALAASTGSRFYYEPGANKTTKVGLIIENAVDLKGFQVRITFDPSVVQIEDANPNVDGVQAALGSMYGDALIAANRVDNTKGEILISAAKPGKEVSGTTDLIWFNVKGVKEGDAKLALADGGIEIVDKQMKEITTAVDTGKLTVPSPGQAPVVNDKKYLEKPVLRVDVTTMTNANNKSQKDLGAKPKDEKVSKGSTDKAPKSSTLDKGSDKTGQILTITGGFILIALIAFQLYRQNKRRYHRRRL